MSTKIYNGFLVRRQSLPRFDEIIAPFKTWVNTQSEKKLEAFIRTGCTWGEWLDRRDAAAKSPVRSDLAVETEFDLFVMPVKGLGIIGIIVSSSRDWTTKFYDTPGVEEFSYWNNSDKPDSITAREWRKRKRYWDALPAGPIADSMYHLRLIPAFGPIPKSHK